MRDYVYSDNKIARALQRHVVLRLVNLLLGFVFQIVLVKNLQPTGFAAYAILLAVVMFGQIVFSFGLYKTISRFVPDFTVNRDFASLGLLVRRLALVRLVSLLLLALALVVGQRALQYIVPVNLERMTVVAFGIWFAASIVLTDTEAFAQSWTAHLASAVVGILEIVGRILVVWLLIRADALSVDTLVTAMAATSALAAILMTIRLWWLGSGLRALGPNEEVKPTQEALDIKRAPLFALANYASMISWGISSPPVVRIAATAGLQVVQLAAFSFVQGLLTSLQRALPGLLLLPSIAPLLTARFASAGVVDRIIGALSLIFKLDLICVLALLILTLVAGEDILRILTQPAYAPYHFILPGVVVLLPLATIYGVLEILVNINLKHRLLGMLWPIGLISIVLIYLTVNIWGLWSVILWPIVEGVTRVGVLLFYFRKEGLWRALDPLRSGVLTLSAALILILSMSIQGLVENASSTFNLILAAGGIIALWGSLFVVRPIRPIEYDAALMIIPQSWRLPKSLLLQIVRP